MPRIKAPFGSWKSPITAKLVTQSSVRFLEAKSYNNHLYFIEMRPQEKGRYALRRYNASTKEISDVEATKDVNVRSRVHEYGGDAWMLLEPSDDERAVYSDFETQSLHLNDQILEDGSKTSRRFTNGSYDAVHDSFVFVCEDHSVLPEAKEPKNSIVEWKRNSDGNWVSHTIAEGHNFYSSPQVSPDGSRIAFVAWDHPNMPWDSTILYEFDRASAKLATVAGDGDESIAQPKYSPDNVLFFISDRSDGYWNIHKYSGGDITCIWKKDTEFCGPSWRFDRDSYQFFDSDSIICVHGSDKGSQLVWYNMKTDETTNLNSPFRSVSCLSVTRDKSRLFFIGGNPDEPTSLCEYNFSTRTFSKILSEMQIDVDKGYFSVPKSIEYPTPSGVAYGNYYPPTNPEFEGEDSEKPIVLLKCHGGPTASASSRFNLQYQYWTSRGIAIFDVNYSGSTGYGREFRRKLYKNWGEFDVQDCEAAVNYLSENGLADANKACIDGGSAGGYSCLACLAFTDVFSAGCSLYGVADLELLASHTHKFESRYLDKLIGEYPKEKEIYQKRSPIHSIDKIKAPLLLLQGAEDKIVPPSQAELMYNRMKESGRAVSLKIFPGEQHGFRGEEAIIQALEMELSFYGRVLGFTPAGDISDVDVENL